MVIPTQLILWLISYKIDNLTLVDVSWAFIHFLIGTRQATNNFKNLKNLSPGNILGYTLLTIWFLRLSGFLFYTRIWNRHKDPRYTEMVKEYNIAEHLFSFFQFQFQGVLIAITAIPLYFMFIYEKSLLNYFAAVLVAVGIIGQSIADFQLQTFKQNRKDDKDVYRGGLFKKARHPNLFFDLCIWTGFATFSVKFGKPDSYLAFLGPVFLWCLMNFVTIPITTKHMKLKRPGYEEVIKNTNKFIPF
jgi:steroid 5-alpha reductase family enzyme